MKLLKDHTHAGKQYQAGDTFEPDEIGMTDDQVTWLKSIGVVETVQPASVSSKKQPINLQEAEQ